MGTRREARERAVQFLFQSDLNPPEDLEAALSEFWETQQPEPEHRSPGAPPASPDDDAPAEPRPLNTAQAAMRLFAETLIRGTLENREAIAAQIQKLARSWALHRMAVVDRNILRAALFEMQHCEDVPPVVTINEAVEIAKRYSTEESGKFVNGILDSFKKTLRRGR